MVKVQLELGGKDPIYVCEDVDAKAAAAALADGAFYNNGQSCCAVERIYVADAIHDAFVDAFVAEVKGFRIGRPDGRGDLPRAGDPPAAARRAGAAGRRREKAGRRSADRRQADPAATATGSSRRWS